MATSSSLDIAVITGGTGVIGSAIAEALACSGVTTVILGREKAKVEAKALEISKKTNALSIGIQADILSKESLRAAKETIERDVGIVSMLVTCAGANSPKATTKSETLDAKAQADDSLGFFGLDINGFDEVYNLNVKGTILPCMIFAKEMAKQKKGSILTISSMNSYRPLTKIPAYSSAKASVNNFTQWLAVHLAPVNIRVNAVAPGFFLTNQNKFLLIEEKSGKLLPRAEKIIAHTPMGRFGDPREVADAAVFLLSKQAQFITGVILPVDGGFSAFSGV